jgi:4-amino-4-deoxy-L-arabinose transferase-like glycosyltransferase
MIARGFSLLAKGRVGLFAGLMIFIALVAMGWVGFLGSDDVTYAHGAYGWLEHFPYVGGHGTIRYFITLPMALCFLVFGQNEVAMVLPTLLYAGGLLAFAWATTARAGDRLSATGALVLLATSPLLVIQSSIANVDAIEAFFLFASVFLFWRCLDEGPNAKRLFGAGLLAGCAFLTRETAIFIAVFYGLCFLVGHRFDRTHYLWIAGGFLSIWVAELLYLWAMTGDPLYRFNIALHHDSTIDRSIDLAGNTIVNPILDPLLVLLINQEFMLLFVAAIPLGAWLCLSKSIEPRLRHFARMIALFGLVWFVCAGAAQKLLPLNPRYFTITCVAACILTGIALVQLGRDGGWKRRFAVFAFLALIGANFLGAYVENKDGLFGERQLARLTADRPGAAIHTDPMTRYRADMLLKWQNAEVRVDNSPPKPGDLYLYNPPNADAPNFEMSDPAPYRPSGAWRVVGRWEPETSYAAQLLDRSGFASRLPQGIWHKLRYRHAPVTLYEVR